MVDICADEDRVAVPDTMRDFGGISMRDRMQIMDRLARYSWSIDEGNLETYLDNFVENAVLHHPLRNGLPGEFRGHDGITEFVQQGFEARPEQTYGHQHQFGAVLMEPEGDGIALKAYCVVLRHEFHRQYWPGGASRRMGTWHASLRKVEDEWKISSLEIRMWTDTALGAGTAVTNRPVGAPGTR